MADYLGRFWVDSLVHDASMLSTLIELIGEQRVALGSDDPFPLGEAAPGTVIDAATELSEATRSALRSGAALELLGLSADTFTLAGAATKEDVS